MSDALVKRQPLVVLKHAQYVLEGVWLEVPLGEPLIGQEEDALGDAPQADEGPLVARILGDVKCISEAAEEAFGNALIGQGLTLIRRYVRQRPGEVREVLVGRVGQHPFVLPDGIPDAGDVGLVLEAEGPILLRLGILPDDDALLLTLALEVVGLAGPDLPVVQDLAAGLVLEHQSSAVTVRDDGDNTGALVLPFGVLGQCVQLAAIPLLLRSLFHIHPLEHIRPPPPNTQNLHNHRRTMRPPA
mmetsp:Transcript_47048/g.133848  ORF Transcript_47048/g.133848 Transcript_47048/m.133848 type:complete len:244 (-) Transcript_47048:10-741(-)